jgi:hypothetical protein
MISRLTTFAAVFAVFAAASMTYAAAPHQAALTAPVATAKQVRTVQLQPVVVTAKRLQQAPV